MKKSKFTEAQVAAALRECVRAGRQSVARKLGVSEQTLYTWKKRYASLDTADIRKLRQLEEENAKLKGLVAGLSLDKVMLQDLLSRKWGARRGSVTPWRCCRAAIASRRGVRANLSGTTAARSTMRATANATLLHFEQE